MAKGFQLASLQNLQFEVSAIVAVAIEDFSALTDEAERNHLLAEMAEQSTDMISRHTPGDWRFLYASPAVKHLLGYSVEEIVGLSAYDLYHPDDVDNFARRTSNVRYERGLYTHTYRFRCKDNHYTWLESTSRSIRDPLTGILKEILVVSRDASSRIEAEQSNRRLARVLESTQDLVIFTDQSQRITHLNESARRTLMLRSAEPATLTLQSLFPETSLCLLETEAFPTAMQSRSWTGELDMLGRRDSSIPVKLELLAHRALYGDIEYFSIVAHNLLEAKQAETQLNQYKAEIEHASRLVTLGELATSLAHELNQPLTAIVNYARGMQRRFQGRADVSWQELQLPLDRTVSTAIRAGQIIHRMMDFTRKRGAAKESVKIDQVIRDMVQFCETNAARDHVVIDTEIDSRLPAILTDRIQLEQVLLNLMMNAIEAAPGCSPEQPSHIHVEACQDAVGMLRISICDEGPGLPTDDMELLFKQFFTTKDRGMGMGLAISRSLVENLGGELRAENRSNGGACFHFTLTTLEGD